MRTTLITQCLRRILASEHGASLKGPATVRLRHILLARLAPYATRAVLPPMRLTGAVTKMVPVASVWDAARTQVLVGSPLPLLYQELITYITEKYHVRVAGLGQRLLIQAYVTGKS